MECGVELSGGMTCLYKLMVLRAAPEHVMVLSNVFAHSLPFLFLSHSIPPQGFLYLPSILFLLLQIRFISPKLALL